MDFQNSPSSLPLSSQVCGLVALSLEPDGECLNPHSRVFQLCDLGQVTSPFCACFLQHEDNNCT